MKKLERKKTITVTFIMSNPTFMWIWSVASKKGGKFNEFLVDYYINEIAEHFPKVDKVIPKIYGVGGSIQHILGGGGTPDMPSDYDRMYCEREATYNKLKENFFVEKSKIINPIMVGI